MENNKFIEPYNEEYSKNYDEFWGNNERFKKEVEFHIECISKFVKGDLKWLDAGCGTGFFLKQMNHKNSAGFDISETMLSAAKKNYPDALFYKQHSLIQKNDDWLNSWDFISCTGQPWAYLKNLNDFELMIENFSNWLSDKGSLLIMINDSEDYLNIDTNISANDEINNYKIISKAIILDTYDNGVCHKGLIFPTFSTWLGWLEAYFDKIELFTQKIDGYSIKRRAVVCSGKKLSSENESNFFVDGIKFRKSELNNKIWQLNQ